MRQMKDSGIEWIGEIPSAWQLIRTKNCYFSHKNIVGESADNYERLALTLGGVIKRPKDDAVGLQPEAFNGYQILYENDLVFKLIDLANVSTSRVGYSPYTGIVSPAYIILTPRHKSESRFGEYFFLSMWQREIFNHMGDDGVRSALNVSDLLNIPYLDMPIEEKRAIVRFLDRKCAEIDTVIADTQKTIEEYKALKQSIITEAVTKGIRGNRPMKDSGIEWIGEIPEEWEISKFKHLGSCRNGLTYSPADQCDEEGTLVLRSSNIQNGKLCLDDCVYVNRSIAPDLMVRPNDILICSRNGSAKLIGKNAIIPEGVTASFGAFMMIYRCKHPRYLQFILNSDVFSYYLGTFLTVSVNQLTGSNFENIQFPYTKDENEQNEIIDYLEGRCDNIDKLIGMKQELIRELESYKKSLIYEYVTGKKEVPVCP